jgi:hypothetical protein
MRIIIMLLESSKSELKFKENLWFLNENDSEDNKIVFDKSFKNFDIDDIIFYLIKVKPSRSKGKLKIGLTRICS